MPCCKRIKEIQTEDSKEREIEDGWITTENPMNKEGNTGNKVAEAMDIDDMDMENIEGNEDN